MLGPGPTRVGVERFLHLMPSTPWMRQAARASGAGRLVTPSTQWTRWAARGSGTAHPLHFGSVGLVMAP